MADFNQILTPGDVENGIVNVVVEIPQGSNHKIEWNRQLAVMQLDRVEPAIFAKPTNYGFIPQTLDEDGDELDALIITDQPLTTGIFMEAKVIDGCISCGACIATCPEVFRFDEDGLAEAYAKVTPEHESAAIEAKEECPVAVIMIEE